MKLKRRKKKTIKEQKPKIETVDLEASKQFLKILLRERMAKQDTRKAMDNRIGRKADGKDQNLDNRIWSSNEKGFLEQLSNNSRLQEKLIEKEIKKILENHTIYNEYLKTIKGVGVITAGWIVALIDINIATTVSKIWQYAGLNPAMILGKKSINKSKYKKSDGEIIGELPPTKEDEKRLIVKTDKKIRGDKLSPGFISPFNKQLKMVLLGILADTFIKSKSEYKTEYYDPYKDRLSNSKQITKEIKKGKGEIEIPWCETTLMHRNMAAKRYMIKMFLKDLYVAWRTIEGLPVRKPYEEEYLGIKHHKAA